MMKSYGMVNMMMVMCMQPCYMCMAFRTPISDEFSSPDADQSIA